MDDAVFHAFNTTFWDKISRELRFLDEMDRFVPLRRDNTAACKVSYLATTRAIMTQCSMLP